MPSRVVTPASSIIKLTNCRLVHDGALVKKDLWINPSTGKIVHDQEAFYTHQILPTRIIDLGGNIVAPGFIDVQLNGAQGFDFSVVEDGYAEGLKKVNKALVKTGVTSYLPTVCSQTPETYRKVLPFLGPSGPSHTAQDGAESLGAHVEGPYMNPKKKGCHNVNVLRVAQSMGDVEDCYGAENLRPSKSSTTPIVKMMTAAPEMGTFKSIIPELKKRGIIYSIGHSDATYAEALDAVEAGANMITHMFNGMRSFSHRDPGIFGLLGQTTTATATALPPTPPRSPLVSPTNTPRKSSPNPSTSDLPNTAIPRDPRPYFGIIADGVHLHPNSVRIAASAHPNGLILVTDAMALSGLPDGTYPWINSSSIVKRGPVLTLASAPDTIAGSAVTLLECINNFLAWCDDAHTVAGVAEKNARREASLVRAVEAVTKTPAEMLGMQGVKGVLAGGADADFVVLKEVWGVGGDKEGKVQVGIESVWKFGECVFEG